VCYDPTFVRWDIRTSILWLVDILPQFANELEQLLKTRHEFALAAQVKDPKIVSRCDCGDDFCGSFYTQPKPAGPMVMAIAVLT
jgi:hypothetical protein